MIERRLELSLAQSLIILHDFFIKYSEKIVFRKGLKKSIPDKILKICNLAYDKNEIYTEDYIKSQKELFLKILETITTDYYPTVEDNTKTIFEDMILLDYLKEKQKI